MAIPLLWVAGLFPLLLVLSALISQKWNWGLMDDLTMLSYPGNILARFSAMHHKLLSLGRFYPFYMFHSAFFYKIFQNNPLAFFLFRFFEVLLTLNLWGLLSYRLTKRFLSVPLLFIVSLSLYKFYDAFFYLSTQEILGTFFIGASLLFLQKFLSPVFTEDNNPNPLNLGLSVLLLCVAFTAKEPFVSCGMAMGLSLLGLWIFNRTKKVLLYCGIILFVFSAGYAAFLKIFIAKVYTSGYSLSDTNKLWANFQDWVHSSFFSHLPWLVLLFFIYIFARKTEPIKRQQRWGQILGVLLYVLYFLLIIPWSGAGHYVAPLAVFFGFGFTLFACHKLEAVPAAVFSAVALAALIINLFVSTQAVTFHRTYQYDTANMVEWMSENILFKTEVLEKGATVRCNAQEPSGAIPQLVKRKYKVPLKEFIFTPQVKKILEDKNTKYYVWGTSWGSQDLRRLGNMWTPMFVSRYWYIFRRMY